MGASNARMMNSAAVSVLQGVTEAYGAEPAREGVNDRSHKEPRAARLGAALGAR